MLVRYQYKIVFQLLRCELASSIVMSNVLAYSKEPGYEVAWINFVRLIYYD